MRPVAQVVVVALTTAAVSVAAAGADALRIKGTDGADRLVGSAAHNLMAGYAGDDRMWGKGADDTIRAGGGDDRLVGGPGDDLMFASRGSDVVIGNRGDDSIQDESAAVIHSGTGDDQVLVRDRPDTRIWTGRGDDDVNLTRGKAIVHLGAGHDRILANGRSGIDAPGDVSCGPGRDHVVYTFHVDPSDTLHGCERVTISQWIGD